MMEVTLPQIGEIGARIAAIPFILYNLSWTSRGFWNLLKGNNLPANIYQSAAFLFTTVLLGYTIMAFTGSKDLSHAGTIVSFFLQCIALLSMILVSTGRFFATYLDFERFYWLFNSNNLDLAVRVGRLNEIDSELTDKLIDSVETTFFTLRSSNEPTERTA